MKLIASMLTLVALVAAAPGAAEACGVWHMQDKVLKRKVTFYVENVLITRPRGKRGPRKMILRISGKSADDIYSKLGRRKHMYFEGNTLRRRGKLIGTITGDTVELRKKRFTVGVTHRPGWGPHHHWEVKVTQGERLVASGKAMAMCMGGGAPPGEQDAAGLALERKEIQRRVILYLAWRQLVRR